MQTYQATGVVGLNAGAQVKLSKEQAASRAHALTAQGKGVYLVRERIEFKAGEIFGLDGDLPKHLAELAAAKTAKKGSESDAPAASSGSGSSSPAADQETDGDLAGEQGSST